MVEHERSPLHLGTLNEDLVQRGTTKVSLVIFEKTTRMETGASGYVGEVRKFPSR